MRTIEEIRQECLDDQIPVIEEAGIRILCELIARERPGMILEAGTGEGYSALRMAQAAPKARIITLEKDPRRYKRALEHIEAAGYSGRITALNEDALAYQPAEEVDLLFIDAAKACNRRLFDRFAPYVRPGGYIAIDDIRFHGFTDDLSLVRTRRLRQLVKKVRRFREEILADPGYDSRYFPEGDGLIIARKK